MATLLLVAIFIDFIGLGIPDSLLGACWPSIYPDLAVSISAQGILSFITSACTVVSSLFAARVINRFGTPKVTAVSTVVTALAILGYSLSGNIYLLVLCAIPLGLGAGAIDSGLNNYVSLHYSATHMSLLHCFYGVGVSISPYIASLLVTTAGGWRSAYKTMFFVQLGISLVTILSLPLWKRANGGADGLEEDKQETVPLKKLIKMPAVVLSGLMLFGAVAVECTAGAWSSSYFVNSRELARDTAAAITTCFYAGLAVGRLVSGLIATKLSAWKIIKLSSAFLALSIVLLMLPLPTPVSAVALFFIGFGVGPLFPNIIHIAPASFGREISQSTISFIMAFSYVGITLMPPLFGLLAEISTDIYPFYIFAMFILFFATMSAVIKALKKAGRPIE